MSHPNASRSTGSGPPRMIENTRIALKELPLAENAARCGKVCKELSHLPAIENQLTRTLWTPLPIGDSPAAMAGHFDGLCHGPTTIKGSRCYLGGSGSAHETAACCPVQHVMNLARQARKRRCRGHCHPCRPMAGPHHGCSSHGHPGSLTAPSCSYRSGSDILRPRAGLDLSPLSPLGCLRVLSPLSHMSFPVEYACASVLLSGTFVVSR